MSDSASENQDFKICFHIPQIRYWNSRIQTNTNHYKKKKYFTHVKGVSINP